MNVQFKTQLLNNYRTNSNDLAAAFLSPGELNLGLGMTYNYENPKKTRVFTAALSPLSYNLKMCTNSRLDPAAFGMEEGKRTLSQYGSSAELTFRWKLAFNIEYFSRMFIFTNYEYVQSDWGEHHQLQHKPVPDHPHLRPSALSERRRADARHELAQMAVQGDTVNRILLPVLAQLTQRKHSLSLTAMPHQHQSPCHETACRYASCSCSCAPHMHTVPSGPTSRG